MGLLFSATLVSSCWGGESGHQWTCEWCILLRPIAMALLSDCSVAVLWHSACLPYNLFLMARDVLELTRVAESKGSLSLLPLLRASLHPWPEHPHREDNREGKMKERDDEGWSSPSGKEINVGNRRFSSICYSCLALPRTYHRSLDTSNKLWYCRFTE